MDRETSWLVVLVTVAVGLFGSLVLGATGIAVGAAARYGIPAPFRRASGWLLAAISLAVMTALYVVARTDPDPAAWFAVMMAGWLPGFVAASLGANRWMLAGMIPAGMVLGAAVAIWLGYPGIVAPPV